MSESHARHAAPDADVGATLPHPGDTRQSGLANPKATLTVRFWTVPIVISVVVLAALAVFYHQVFLGARSLLYFDGQADAGLSQALTMTAIGLVVGLLLGGIVTWIYDRRGYHRIPPGLEASTAATTLSESAATAELTTEATSAPE